MPAPRTSFYPGRVVESEAEPRPEWPGDSCAICPGQRLGLGAFDVVDRPSVRFAFDKAAGCRVDLVTGVPVCVHPFRIGLEPAAYASAKAGWSDGAHDPDPTIRRWPYEAAGREARRRCSYRHRNNWCCRNPKMT